MKNFFIALSAIFASIPGLSVLISSIGVPDPDDKLLFAALIEIFGCATLGLILLNKATIIKMDLKKLNYLISACFLLFFLSVISYLVIHKICVKEHDGNTSVYFPLFLGDQLENEVNSLGGKLKFIEKWLGDGSNSRIRMLANPELIFTTVLFLIVYQLIFTSLTAGFGFLAMRQSKDQ